MPDAADVQPPPPRIASGRSRAREEVLELRDVFGDGLGWTRWKRGASATSTSGREHVLRQREHDRAGPPAHAVENARARSSGMRSGRSIWATHFAIGPNMRR